MADKDCIFCKIVKGEIPCHKVYEDDDFLAFLDIAPFVEGHTLI
ncbi:HIT family protein, partial [Candidatus Shapirobacteria bacterium CG10_big_fil_rev_8_21_14_0_10_38_14]